MAISGRQLRFCRGFPVIRPGTARLPRPLRGLAMTRQGGAAVHQRPYAVELSRTRRSLSAATGPVGTGSILTIVCAYRQHCAGRGMPRPSAKRQSDGQFGAMHRSRRHAPLICHCEEAVGRRGNLAVPGRIVGKPSAKSQLPPRDSHVASLLGMTRLGGAVVHQCPSAVELSPTRRSMSAATDAIGWYVLSLPCTGCKCLHEIPTSLRSSE